MLEKSKIDSFKIRIPERFVQIVDPTFLERYQKVYISTGQVEDEIRLDNHKVNIQSGITTRIGKAHFLKGDREEVDYYIQITAKMLRVKYLEGINKDNIREVYNYLMDLKIIYIEYDNFINGFVTDVDYAYDFYCEPKTLQIIIPKLERAVPLENRAYIDKTFTQDNNIGISFNKREKATNKHPFIKIYHKSTELRHKSKVFAEAFLLGQDYENIARLEFTIKNKKHREYLKLRGNRLIELLELDLLQIDEIVTTSIKKHYMKNEVSRSKTIVDDNMNYTDLFIMSLMQDLINKGYDEKDFTNKLKMFPDATKVEQKKKLRFKKKLDSYLTDLLESETGEKLDLNKKERDVLRTLKLDDVID